MKPIESAPDITDDAESEELIMELTEKMYAAAEKLDFEEAARLRDQIQKLQGE